MKTTNLIANEYQISTNLIKCRIENHFIKDRNYLSQLNSEAENEDLSLFSMNQAELNAIKAEQIRLEEEIRKKKQIEDISKKLKEKVKADKLNNKEKLKEIKKMEQEKKTKSEKIKEYDKKLRIRQIKEENNTPLNIIQNNVKITDELQNEDRNGPQNLNPSSPKFNTLSIKNNQTFSFNDSIPKDNMILKEEKPILNKTRPTSEKEFNIKNHINILNVAESKEPSTQNKIESITNKNSISSNVIDIRDRILNLIKEKLDSEFQPSQKSYTNGNLENISSYNDEMNINQEMNKNVEYIKEFRKKGIINLNNHSQITKNNQTNINNNFEAKQEINHKNSEVIKKEEIDAKTQKQNELEKRRLVLNLLSFRYTKALRNIMIEKFKEKSIIIPNICSCGQLQKKLDTLLENKNISVHSNVNVECANNCIYYNNTNDYHKAISDIIQSVKNLKFDSFHS